jgi:hypothetical protein
MPLFKVRDRSGLMKIGNISPLGIENIFFLLDLP